MAELCGELVEIDARTFNSMPPLAPRLRLKEGELSLIPRVITICLQCLDCRLVVEVELLLLLFYRSIKQKVICLEWFKISARVEIYYT